MSVSLSITLMWASIQITVTRDFWLMSSLNLISASHVAVTLMLYAKRKLPRSLCQAPQPI
jgi:hypothetical protein